MFCCYVSALNSGSKTKLLSQLKTPECSKGVPISSNAPFPFPLRSEVGKREHNCMYAPTFHSLNQLLSSKDQYTQLHRCLIYFDVFSI